MNTDLRIAIVGSGPAGLYAAAELVKQCPLVQLNLIEKLPCIGGLARFGVAPDHTERRQVIGAYEKLARSSGRLAFYGNVAVGEDLGHDDLMLHHHAVIYATGAFNGKPLKINGAALPGCWSSRDFVAWYNGHPDFAQLDINLDCERAVVVGNGNVALDIARILLKSTAELADSDLPADVRRCLHESRIREVLILGRRNPAEAKFTYPELHELGILENIAVTVSPDCLDSAAWRDGDFSTQLKRAWFENCARNDPANSQSKHLKFEFLSSPTEIHGDDSVTGLTITRNCLQADDEGIISAHPTASTTTIEAGLVVHALGYRVSPIAGLPMDGDYERVSNSQGRVLCNSDDENLAGAYVTGWLKRGPRGVIGSNKLCAAETVASLLEDFAAGRLAAPSEDNGEFEAWMKSQKPNLVDYRGWKAIDQYEKSQVAHGSAGEKLANIEEMLAVAGVSAT